MALYPHNYAEIIAAVVCTICFLYKPSVTNRWFVGFLWLTVVVEFSAKMLIRHQEAKTIMYNVFNIIEFIFYLLFFAAISLNIKDTKRLKILTILISVFGIVNIVFLQNALYYNHYTTIIGSGLLIFACLLMYSSTLSDKALDKFFVVQLLVVSALLLFYAGNFFVYASYSYLLKRNPTFLVSIYKIVNGFLNVIMYGCFTIAFIVEVFYNKRFS